MSNGKLDGVIVFWGSSMRGGNSRVPIKELQEIQDVIEELGATLASKHQTEPGAIEADDQITPRQVYDREHKRMKKSHVGVFEVSDPSHGVGAQIAEMLNMGIPVLCLYSWAHVKETEVSAYIRGMPGTNVRVPFCCEAYHNVEVAARAHILNFILETVVGPREQ